MYINNFSFINYTYTLFLARKYSENTWFNHHNDDKILNF